MPRSDLSSAVEAALADIGAEEVLKLVHFTVLASNFPGAYEAENAWGWSS